MHTWFKGTIILFLDIVSKNMSVFASSHVDT